MYLRIPPLRMTITLESNPQKSTMLVGRLGVGDFMIGPPFADPPFWGLCSVVPTRQAETAPATVVSCGPASGKTTLVFAVRHTPWQGDPRDNQTHNQTPEALSGSSARRHRPWIMYGFCHHFNNKVVFVCLKHAVICLFRAKL